MWVKTRIGIVLQQARAGVQKEVERTQIYMSFGHCHGLSHWHLSLVWPRFTERGPAMANYYAVHDIFCKKDKVADSECWAGVM
jgi:hypothetical protein